MQFRQLVALLLVTTIALMLLADQFFGSPILRVAIMVAVLAMAALVLPVHPKTRIARASVLNVLWFLTAGLILAVIIQAMIDLASVITLVLPFQLTYATQWWGALLIVVLAIATFVSPSVAITVGERLFRKKWLWGAILMETSYACASVFLAPGWETRVFSPSTIIDVVAIGIVGGYFSLLIATSLAGFNLKDFSYLKFEITNPLSNIVSTFRQSDLFAHAYRSPSIQSENPLRATIRVRGESYVARIYGSMKDDTSELQIASFHPRTFLGELYRDTRSDAICNDILAILCRAMNCIPRNIVGPSSQPRVLQPEFWSFALRETRERLSPIGGAMLARARVLTKIALVLVGILLIWYGYSNPKEPLTVFVFGFALPVFSFIWTFWERRSK
jgi:hypothetical protein